jgi:hypothetical protein
MKPETACYVYARMSNSSNDAPLWVYLVVLGLTLTCGYYGFPQPKEARRVLEAEGYTSIKVNAHGGDGFSCGDDDGHATGFTARRGDLEVKGVVCSGWFFKASTVRVVSSKPLTPPAAGDTKHP